MRNEVCSRTKFVRITSMKSLGWWCEHVSKMIFTSFSSLDALSETVDEMKE